MRKSIESKLHEEKEQQENGEDEWFADGKSDETVS